MYLPDLFGSIRRLALNFRDPSLDFGSGGLLPGNGGDYTVPDGGGPGGSDGLWHDLKVKINECISQVNT